MNRLVVDGSVVAKLLFEEEHSDAAVRLVREASELLAPDLIWAEVGNVAWKRHLRGELTSERAIAAMSEALRLRIDTVAIEPLITLALEIAMTTTRTVYDSLYLALAIDRNCPFVTADRRLVNALAGGPLAGRVRWIGG